MSTFAYCKERYPHRPLIQDMDNTTAHVGESLTLHCRVFSDGTPFIQWYRHFEINGSYTDEFGNPHEQVIPVRTF